MWVTLNTCSATKAIILDLVPSIDSDSFQNSIRRFISRRGCPSHFISDSGSNFNAGDTQAFVNNLGVTWHANLPLAPRHMCFFVVVFFQRLVRSTKDLLRKE